MTQQAEKHVFQAEVNQILSLVVNSLYTHKEIFLRELISNASDALDHLAFRVLTEPDVMGDDAQLEIRVAIDKDARTLTISDNGVGMGHDELVTNLGTIAHSGTRRLAEEMTGDAKSDISLIGQFGVGFYSAFLVADRVAVTSRMAGSDAAWCWESTADGSFTIVEATREGRGTDIVLHMKTDDEIDDFLREWTLRDLVRKYSDYVRHPIRLRTEKTTPKSDDDDSGGETTIEWEQVNSGAALWTRPRSEITDENANDFYKHLTRDWEPPLARTHFKTEGMQSLTGLLFVPRRSPLDMYMSKDKGIRLFVKRVFIMDDCEALLPDYLRFVRGVVDSDDLPLNVSREFLQKDRTTAGIRKQVVRHILRLLQELADEEDAARKQREAAGSDDSAADSDSSDDSDDTTASDGEDAKRYTTFWNNFGRLLKEGVHSDSGNRDKLAKLLRYESSHGPGLHSLEDVVGRLQEGQEAIYYIVAPSRQAAATAPHVEALRSRGYEVVYMTDAIDEWVVDSLTEFEGTRFVSASKGALDLPESEDEKKDLEEKKESLAGLVAKIKGVLDDDVEDVRVTTRLTDSPACLVVPDGGIAPHVERMLRQQNADMPSQKRILEINPKHPVVERLNAIASDESRADDVADWSRLLFDQALVAEGSPPSDPAGFARRITSLLSKALGSSAG